jgi:hypothetical protein
MDHLDDFISLEEPGPAHGIAVVVGVVDGRIRTRCIGWCGEDISFVLADADGSRE